MRTGTRRTSAAVFILSLVLFSFAAAPVHFVGGSDEPTYLTAARDGLHAFDGRPFVLHPPVYPLALRAVACLVPSFEAAAALLGILACALLVAVTHRLALAAGASEEAALVAALGLASTRGLAFVADGAFREPLEVLLLDAAVLAVVRAEGKGLGLGAGLAALAALTFDLSGLAAPLLAATGFLVGKRRAGVVAAVSGTVAWLAWASFRAHTVAASSPYPAGIDGLLEDTSHFSPGAFVNPNLLPETAAHNAYFWPLRFSPGNLLLLAAPSLLAGDTRALDAAVSWPAALAAGAWIALALLGLVLAPREKARSVLAIAAPALLAGAPGLLGKQARYSLPLLPALFILAGLGTSVLAERARERTKRAVLLFATIALGLAVIAQRPRFAPARSWLFETRSVAAVASALAPGSRVVAFHGLPPELAWLLPGKRVLALPLRAERVDELFRVAPPDLVVLPLGVAVPAAATPRDLDALGASGFLAVRGRPGLVELGIAFEAEAEERPRLRAYRVLAAPSAGLASFGALLPRGEALAAALAVEASRSDAGAVDPGALDALRASRSVLARSDDPDVKQLARLLAEQDR
jgi:hypothetical protein